jgi:signal transduction histidine kinase
LGETSLERKCRLLLGGGILVAILLAFFLYGYQSEKLVWDQTELTGQLLVTPTVLNRHWRSEEITGSTSRNEESTGSTSRTRQILDAFSASEPGANKLPYIPKGPEYTSRLLRFNTDAFEYRPTWPGESELMKRLQQALDERSRSVVTEADTEKKIFRYAKAVLMEPSCLVAGCHPTNLDRELKLGELKPGSVHSAVIVTLDLRDTELAINLNRAILISFAILTALVAMVLAYATIRYVIVKPLTHLREVSEEIAAGNLTIRSNIQTGDEFQELSHAYNRMIRSLVSMQDELRKVNTDLDRKLDELAQANMALFEMNRLKSEFLATISHELRTPLNSILGFSDLLVDLPEADTKQKRWITNIQSSGKVLLNLINDILDLAKMQAGKMQVNVEEFSLRDVVEGLIQMTRPLADKRNLSLTSEIDPAIPIMHQDSRKVQQILSNLLSNAIKFTPEGGRVVVSCRPDRAFAVMSVIDNGVGIAPEDQKLIFEKFRQAESGLTRQHSGTGLGLSIVRELTKLLGGDDVALESELGRGSTFTVRIPIYYDDSRPAYELTLTDAAVEFSTARQTEVRFYESKDRPVGAEVK